MNKRILSTFLVLAMLLSMVPTAVFAATEDTVTTPSVVAQVTNDLVVADQSVDTIGTGNNPFLIGSAAVLAELATLVNNGATYFGLNYSEASYIMVADIDLCDVAWTAIGTYSAPFKGTFDGDGYAITGLNVSGTDCQGLFGYSTGTIKNLTVSGTVTATSNYAGGIVGRNDGGTVEHCAFSGTVSGVDYVGGVVGYNKGTVNGCFATGTVDASASNAYVGGIVGSNSSNSTVSNCVSLVSSVSTSGTYYSCVFRVVGFNNGALSNNYAWTGTEIGLTGALATTTGATDDRDGGDLSYSDSAFSTTWSTIYSGWTASSSLLPNGEAVPSYITATDVWDGTAAESFAVANEISTAAELKLFANSVNDGAITSGTYTLMADIDLNGETWTPIGTNSAPFQGTFNGNNHTISGLNVVASGTDYQGLFGYSTGTIKNLTVSGTVTATGTSDCVGGIAGHNMNGIVKNCTFLGTVSGNDNVGGIVGYNYGNSCIVENCAFQGTVSGSNYVGGIVGYNHYYGTVSGCFATGTVDATYNSGASVGGIVGSNANSSKVTNCVALQESVSGTSDSYTYRVVGNNSSTGNPSLADNYAWSGTKIGQTGSLSTTTGVLENNNGDDLTYTAGAFSTTWSDIYSGWDGDSGELPNGDSVPSYINTEAGDGATGDVATGPWGGSADTEATWTGAGSYESPYIITTGGQLAYLADQVNANTSYSSTYFQLGCDIDLNSETWTAIGTQYYPFAGTFDGNNYTISGLSITGSSSYTGLFGNNTGTIRNLNVSGTITGGARTGGIVGLNDGGTVEYCTFTGTITGGQYTGGIVGLNNGGTVEHCTFTGTITGGQYTGGIVGRNQSSQSSQSSATVQYCAVSGTVTGSSTNVGGVVGCNSSSFITYCYNTASVTGDSYNVGGVTGYNSGTVKNCYNTGAVTSGSHTVGGVVASNNGTLSHCYNTGSVTSTYADAGQVGGVVGYNSSSGTISNCVSLANTITTAHASSVGRVVGSNDNETALANNYAWSGTTLLVSTSTPTTPSATTTDGMDGADLFYISTTGFSESWTDMGFTAQNGWTAPTTANALLPTLMGETAQIPLANLHSVTITLDYDTEGVAAVNIVVEAGSTLTADQIPAGTWEDSEYNVLSTNTVHTADNTFTVDTHSLTLTDCPCGDDHNIEGDWYPISTATDFTTLEDGRNYYLLTDIATTSTITIDKTINLCLNGNSIERLTGSELNFSVITIVENGTLNLYDGTGLGEITGGDGSDVNGVRRGGGVLLYNTGEEGTIPTFNLYGGNITDNYADVGGAVYLFGAGTFNMYGGSITDNHASENGGGVYVTTSATFTMTDGIISGNYTDGDESDENCGGGVYVGGTFTMSGGTITGNTADRDNQSEGFGGGVYTGTSSTFTMSGTASITGNTSYNYGGGVYATGTFNMTGGSITDNTSADGGGGVYLKGTMTMSGTSSIAGNTAAGEGGGIYINDGSARLTMSGGTIGGDGTPNTAGDGGGGVYIDKNGTFTMSAGTISYNVADNTESGNGSDGTPNDGNGGGVYISAGTFTMTGGTIEYNEAKSEVTGGMEGDYEAINATNGNGGGVYVNYGSDADADGIFAGDSGVELDGDDDDFRATFSMSGGTISNNIAQYKGGGVYVFCSFWMGDYMATISNNQAVYGGGVYVNTDATGLLTANKALFTMVEGSITNNTATTAGGGVYVTENAIFDISGGTAPYTSTISGNSATTGDGVYLVGDMYAGGTFTTQEVYLTTDKVITVESAFDSTTVIPVTTSATPTNSDPVTITSGAYLDAVDTTNFTASGYTVTLANDNLNLQLVEPSVLTECPCGCTHEEVSIDWYPLSQAIIASTGYGSLNGYYYLAGDITLSSNKTINVENNDVTICLNGYTIEGTATFEDPRPVFKVYLDQTLTIYDGDYSTDTSNPKYVSDPTGGEDIAVYGGLITGGYNDQGGGVYVMAGGSFHMYGGTIAGNTATEDGGGVYVDRTVNAGYTTSFHMYGGAIIANSAAEFGGGIYIADSYTATGMFSIADADISYNLSQNGGGIYTNAYDLTITRTTITNNYAQCEGYLTGSRDAAGDGAGIYLASNANTTALLSSTIDMDYVTVSDNWAERTGGGVYVETKVAVTMDNCTISGNTAEYTGGGIYAGSYYDGDAGNTTNSNVSMTDSFITGNTAQDGGGAYVSTPYFQLTDTEVSGNFAVEDSTSTAATPVGGDGAGIYIADKNATAYDNYGKASLGTVTITDNHAAVNGGGIYLEGYSAAVDILISGNLTITDNTAGRNGGGIYLSTSGTLIVDSEYTISGNTAINNGAGIYTLGALTLTGAPTIQDELYLTTDKVISFTVVYDGTTIPVATEETPSDGTDILLTSRADRGELTASDFTSSKSYYTIVEDNGEFYLALAVDSSESYYDISGTITDGENITVTLMRGTEVIETTTTDGSGRYSFPYVEEDGTYNVVATDGDKTVTTAVMVESTSTTADATLSSNSSTLVIDESTGTPDVVVVGLNDAADTLGTSIVLTVSNTDEGAEGGTDIATAAGNTVEYLSIALTDGDTAPLGDTGDVLEIIVPYDFTNKENIAVYRYHSGVDTFTELGARATGSYLDGTFYADTANGYLYIYARYFSTYAVAYDVVASSGSSNTTYSSTVASTSNGSVAISSTRNTLNSTVTFTATPDAGYEIGSVSVAYTTGRAVSVTDLGNGKYSYYQPGTAVTVTVTFVSSDGFLSDMDEDDWYYDAMTWAVDNDIVDGDFDGTVNATREQAVYYIWKAMGSPTSTIDNPFTDITEGDEYYEAILWAVETGITEGTNEGDTFSPNMVCDRSQIVTFLWRNAGLVDATATVDFDDVAEGSWYHGAVQWAVETQITQGTGDNAFSPTQTCTTAEIITFLYRQMAE